MCERELSRRFYVTCFFFVSHQQFATQISAAAAMGTSEKGIDLSSNPCPEIFSRSKIERQNESWRNLGQNELLTGPQPSTSEAVNARVFRPCCYHVALFPALTRVIFLERFTELDKYEEC